MRKFYTLRISRICVIFEGKILLVQRNRDSLWEIPGGKVKDKESYYKAAQRELLEETSLKVHTLKQIIAKRREIPHGGSWIGINYYVALEWDTPYKLAPIDSYEIRDLCWFTVEEYFRLQLTVETREILSNKHILRLLTK